MATKTKADVDADTAPETQVDEGLSKLYETYERRETVANTQFVAIIEYVRSNKLSRGVVKATLEDRGLSESSVSTEVSRIMGLSKEENRGIVEQLEAGEITVAAARKALVSKPQERPAKSAQDKLWEALYRAAKMAYKESATNTDFTLTYFTSEAANAWNQVKSEYEEKAAAAQAEAEAHLAAAEV
jgi:hypothetical protein